METNKALIKDEEAEDVDVYLYRSMIGSLMYLTASRPDIMFAVCACARDSPFNLEAFSDSDYARASLDKKSTTGGCQFLGKRLILWQCKKQTILANSIIKAEYVAAANCCGHVLWIQNQMLDYGFNFMNTTIYIDDESTICIVKNLVFHSKTKYIKIRHYFIRDPYEKKLIQVGDEAVHKELGDIMERATTTAFSLEAEQDSGSGLRCQDTILGGVDAQTSHIKYALTENPTIYVSPIHQFWGTASASTSENGEMEITATIDGRINTVTEALIRRHLKLEDSDGIPTLPNAEIFE
ncbi:hypothetical protein Tco_0033148 [Tanacetum coccineum]